MAPVTTTDVCGLGKDGLVDLAWHLRLNCGLAMHLRWIGPCPLQPAHADNLDLPEDVLSSPSRRRSVSTVSRRGCNCAKHLVQIGTHEVTPDFLHVDAGRATLSTPRPLLDLVPQDLPTRPPPSKRNARSLDSRTDFRRAPGANRQERTAQHDTVDYARSADLTIDSAQKSWIDGRQRRAVAQQLYHFSTIRDPRRRPLGDCAEFLVTIY
ncbi:unnamed protein product, partial [Prorocentrum cordatum]